MMIIQLIKTLEKLQPAKLIQISKSLDLDMLKTLSLIADTNNRDEGLIVENAGVYSLSRAMNWLEYAKLKELLANHQLPHQFILFEQVNSTNSYALNNMMNFHTFPLVINAAIQTGGRGRLGRSWSSKIAHDLTISLVYQFPSDFNLTIIPILTAVAINRLLKNYSVRNQIKWPNDIYVNGNKECGILVENLLRNQINHCVIGIGLNNMGNWERNKLTVDLINEFDKLVNEYKLFGFPFLQREWLDNCIHYKRQVTLSSNNVVIACGQHNGITPLGELIIQTKEGKQIFNNSSYSLRFE